MNGATSPHFDFAKLYFSVRRGERCPGSIESPRRKARSNSVYREYFGLSSRKRGFESRPGHQDKPILSSTYLDKSQRRRKKTNFSPFLGVWGRCNGPTWLGGARFLIPHQLSLELPGDFKARCVDELAQVLHLRNGQVRFGRNHDGPIVGEREDEYRNFFLHDCYDSRPAEVSIPPLVHPYRERDLDKKTRVLRVGLERCQSLSHASRDDRALFVHEPARTIPSIIILNKTTDPPPYTSFSAKQRPSGCSGIASNSNPDFTLMKYRVAAVADSPMLPKPSLIPRWIIEFASRSSTRCDCSWPLVSAVGIRVIVLSCSLGGL